jgi:hypothetical protein
MFKAVDRHAFSATQTSVFPYYFSMQTAVPIILAITYPGSVLTGIPSGIHGVLDQAVRWNTLLPLATMFVTGLLNLAVLNPVILGVMKERRGQGKFIIEASDQSGSSG